MADVASRRTDPIEWDEEPALLIQGMPYVSDDEARRLFVEHYSSPETFGFLFGVADEFDMSALRTQRGWFRKRPPLPYEWCNGYTALVQTAPGPQKGAFPAVLVGLASIIGEEPSRG